MADYLTENLGLLLNQYGRGGAGDVSSQLQALNQYKLGKSVQRRQEQESIRRFNIQADQWAKEFGLKKEELQRLKDQFAEQLATQKQQFADTMDWNKESFGKTMDWNKDLQRMNTQAGLYSAGAGLPNERSAYSSQYGFTSLPNQGASATSYGGSGTSGGGGDLVSSLQNLANLRNQYAVGLPPQTYPANEQTLIYNKLNRKLLDALR